MILTQKQISKGVYKEEKDKNFRMTSLLSGFVTNWKYLGHHVKSNEAKRYQEPIIINGWSSKNMEWSRSRKIVNAIDLMPSWIRDRLKQNGERINY